MRRNSPESGADISNLKGQGRRARRNERYDRGRMALVRRVAAKLVDPLGLRHSTARPLPDALRRPSPHTHRHPAVRTLRPRPSSWHKQRRTHRGRSRRRRRRGTRAADSERSGVRYRTLPNHSPGSQFHGPRTHLHIQFNTLSTIAFLKHHSSQL